MKVLSGKFENQLRMKKLLLIFTCLLLLLSFVASAQKKNKKKSEFKMPTEAQQQQYKDYLKRVLKDSMNIPLEKRDTVASIELAAIIKKMKMNTDNSLSKDDKDVQNGMLEDDMYMHMAAVLSMDELQRIKNFDQRQKAASEAADKERKDAENQRNSQIGGMGGGYGRYGGGYRGY